MKKLSDNKVVLISHCIDTEGPLYESIEAKFKRLYELFGINHISPCKKNFEKLKNAEFDLNGKEKIIANIFNDHLSQYNETWKDVDNMLNHIRSNEFRMKLPDSFGNGWFYNWHCMDHVGFENNPRRRDMGYHNIFDHYTAILKQEKNSRDAIHFHFHPISIYKDAHLCATSFINSPEIYQILCRRIIERNWFPSVFRAGFHTERPDSHWFLEQWIPFDISNISTEYTDELDNTIDFKKGRAGDWRLAPSDWSIYNPNHDNYQLEGKCRRWIARVLTVLNRRASIDQPEMDKAFARANMGKPTLVGLTGHDYRNIGTEVDYVRQLITRSSNNYPDVKFKYCEAIEAFRLSIWPEGIYDQPLNFDVTFYPKTDQDSSFIEINTTSGEVFGPQPFLAIQTKSKRFIHDNLDFSVKSGQWFYAFHSNTLPVEDVYRIGVAANDKYGNVCIKHLFV